MVDGTLREERGNIRVALKAGFWYVACSFLLKAIAFLTAPIFTRLMSASEYGDFGNFSSWQQILLILSGAELYSSVNCAYYDFKDTFDDYVTSCMGLSLGIAVLVLTVFYFFGEQIAAWTYIDRRHLLNLALYLALVPLFLLKQSRDRVLYRYKMVSWFAAASILMGTLAATVAVLYSADKLTARLWGQFLPPIILGAICGIILLRRSHVFRWSYCKYAMRIAFPLVINYLLMYLLNSSNTIIVRRLNGSETAALVNLAGSCSNIAIILIQSLTGAMSPWLMDTLNMGKRDETRRVTLIYALCLAGGIVGVMLISPEVVAIMGGSPYREAQYLIPARMCAAVIQGISSLYTIVLTYEKKVMSIAGAAGVSAVVSLGLKYLLIGPFGYQVVVYVDILGSLLLLMMNWWLVRKYARASYFRNRWFWVASLFSAAAVPLCLLLFQNRLARYLTVALYLGGFALAVWHYRAAIADFWKNRKPSQRAQSASLPEQRP